MTRRPTYDTLTTRNVFDTLLAERESGLTALRVSHPVVKVSIAIQQTRTNLSAYL